jgi:hypothetical protein
VEQKKKSKRGGKRPGAGAPKGNLNALKHGRRSAQFAQFAVTLAGNEKTREAMLNFARRLDGKQQTAMLGAVEFHARIIEEARKIARGEPSPLEHILPGLKSQPGTRISDLGTRNSRRIERSISRCRTSLNRRKRALRRLPPTRRDLKTKESPPGQSKSQRDLREQSAAQYEISPTTH